MTDLDALEGKLQGNSGDLSLEWYKKFVALIAELRASRKVVEAAEITLASMAGQYGFPFTLEQFKTWDGPAMLQRALAELEALK